MDGAASVSVVMFSLKPRLTLVLLLSAAGVILLGGTWLARREESHREPRSREPLQQFAGALQGELSRLERLYERHLRDLCREIEFLERNSAAQRCERVIGVKQFSLLSPSQRSARDFHQRVGTAFSGQLPLPAFSDMRNSFPGNYILISPELLNYDNGPFGWIDEPGKPPLFWHRRSNGTLAVLLIDPATVARAIDEWVSEWVVKAWEPVSNAGGPDRLLGSNGNALAEAGVVGTIYPDFLLPVRSRFGEWKLAAWDRWETRVSYHTPTLVISASISVVIALLAIAVSVQQRRALQAAEQRVSFVNRVSHELRAPLTNILLNVDVAIDLIEDADEEPSTRLRLVQEEGRRLGRLIENVLAFSQQERGGVTIRERLCSPDDVLCAVLEQFVPAFQRRGIEPHCRWNAAAPRIIDADALSQIVGNLLSNVEKYAPDSPVEIASELNGEILSVRVADRGPGIPLSEAERIFRPFERLDCRVKEGVTGTGLGLAISRELAGRLGGTLHLVPSEEGACFELRIPAKASTPIAIVSTSAA